MEGGKGWGFKLGRCWTDMFFQLMLHSTGAGLSGTRGKGGDGYQTYQSNIFTVYSIQKLFYGLIQNLSDIKFNADKHFVGRTTVWINNLKCLKQVNILFYPI